jgi:hypothetical protein
MADGDGGLGRSFGVADEREPSRREPRTQRQERPETSTKDDGGAARSPGSVEDPSRGNSPLARADESANAAGGEPGKEAAAADCALPDKDLARESWRRNWPAVCSVSGSGKAFILMPIKGPLEGENHALHRRPTREARVNLAAGAESLLTLKQYKVNRLGFKELRVDTSDNGRNRLRVKLLPGAGDPVFEVKDGYAKITVAVPGEK